jgi:hypothetical protein
VANALSAIFDLLLCMLLLLDFLCILVLELGSEPPA